MILVDYFYFFLKYMNRLFWFFEHAGIAHTPFSVSDATWLSLKSRYYREIHNIVERSLHSFILSMSSASFYFGTTYI